MRDYLKNISDTILTSNNADLTLLRWLIAYHTRPFPDVISDNWIDDKREEMISACKKRNIISKETGDIFSDLEYSQKIYTYGQSIIMKFVKNETSRLSEYSVLLYIYTLAVNSNNQKNPYNKTNPLGKSILKNIKYLCEEPRAGGFIDDKPPKRKSDTKKTVENKVSPIENEKDDFSRLSSVDRLIFALYLWIADFGVLSEYNQKILQLSNAPSYKLDAEKIYQLIYKLPSKLKLFYNNPAHTKNTEKNIHNFFVNFLSEMPYTGVPFAPSIITIFFNSLLPTKVARIKNEFFYYSNLIRKINCGENIQKKYYKQIPQQIEFPSPNDSSFLKMLILPEDGNFIFDKNKKYRIESRFIEHEWTHFCEIYKELYEQAVGKTSTYFYHGWHRQKLNLNWHDFCIQEEDIIYYEENISKYIDKEKIHIPTSKEYKNLDEKCKHYIIKAMKNHSFTFTYLYFEMFCTLAENKKLFSNSSKSSVNIALSMIHLNAYTKWYDAVLLHKGMDFSFIQCDYFFYLKLLTVYKKYKSFVVDISYVDRNILNDLVAKSLKKSYGKTDINCNEFFSHMLHYFHDIADKKINLPSLLNIFKTNSDKKCETRNFNGFNPIYQWIKLLDDTELKKDFFNDITNESLWTAQNITL